jgi:hypothetical protein
VPMVSFAWTTAWRPAPRSSISGITRGSWQRRRRPAIRIFTYWALPLLTGIVSLHYVGRLDRCQNAREQSG